MFEVTQAQVDLSVGDSGLADSEPGIRAADTALKGGRGGGRSEKGNEEGENSRLHGGNGAGVDIERSSKVRWSREGEKGQGEVAVE